MEDEKWYNPETGDALYAKIEDATFDRIMEILKPLRKRFEEINYPDGMNHIQRCVVLYNFCEIARNIYETKRIPTEILLCIAMPPCKNKFEKFEDMTESEKNTPCTFHLSDRFKKDINK